MMVSTQPRPISDIKALRPIVLQSHGESRFAVTLSYATPNDSEPGLTYVPPRMVDSEIVPGHCP